MEIVSDGFKAPLRAVGEVLVIGVNGKSGLLTKSK
jgi:hypothetical protein